jgi:hypothetical protein
VRKLLFAVSLLSLGGACAQPSAPSTPGPTPQATTPPAVQIVDVPRIPAADTAAPTPSASAPPAPSTRPEDAPWPTFARASREDLPPARVHRTYDKEAAEMTAAMQPLFRQCYRRALLEDRKTEGTARLLLKIARGGHVESADVMDASGLSPRLLACCVEAALSRKFPDPGGTSEQIVVPLKFVPKD